MTEQRTNTVRSVTCVCGPKENPAVLAHRGVFVSLEGVGTLTSVRRRHHHHRHGGRGHRRHHRRRLDAPALH